TYARHLTVVLTPTVFSITRYLFPLTCLHPAFFLFFFTILLPSRSTLFPYTTLFRSRRGRRPGVGRDDERPHVPGALRLPSVGQRSEEHTSDSSHVSISYAVFCLKKKK